MGGGHANLWGGGQHPQVQEQSMEQTLAKYTIAIKIIFL